MAFTDATGVELFKWDSSSDLPGSITLVKDINGTSADSNLQNLINVNGTLFFIADPDGGGVGENSAALQEQRHRCRDGHCRSDDLPPCQRFPGFRQHALFRGRGRYDDDRDLWRSEGTDATTFPVTDLFAHFDGIRLQYAFLDIGGPPVLNANTGSTVNEGASTTILNAQLDFNDPDNTDSQITYTVTSLTANGTLFHNAVALGIGRTFTQATSSAICSPTRTMAARRRATRSAFRSPTASRPRSRGRHLPSR